MTSHEPYFEFMCVFTFLVAQVIFEQNNSYMIVDSPLTLYEKYYLVYRFVNNCFGLQGKYN